MNIAKAKKRTNIVGPFLLEDKFQHTLSIFDFHHNVSIRDKLR